MKTKRKIQALKIEVVCEAPPTTEQVETAKFVYANSPNSRNCQYEAYAVLRRAMWYAEVSTEPKR